MSEKHILLIEDDEGILAITKFSLEMDIFWTVTTATNGYEGLYKAKDLQPDVILLDILIPGISAIKLIKNLENNPLTAKIPIIVFTAKPINTNLSKLQNSNIKGFITKPFDCLSLSRQIINILDNA